MDIDKLIHFTCDFLIFVCFSSLMDIDKLIQKEIKHPKQERF